MRKTELYLNELKQGIQNIDDARLKTIYKALSSTANSRLKRLKTVNADLSPAFQALPQKVKNEGFSESVNIIRIINNLPSIISFLKNPTSTLSGYRKSYEAFEKIIDNPYDIKAGGRYIVYGSDGAKKVLDVTELIKPISEVHKQNMWLGYDRFIEAHSNALYSLGSERLINDLHEIRFDDDIDTLYDETTGAVLEKYSPDWYKKALEKIEGMGSNEFNEEEFNELESQFKPFI